MTFFEKPMSDLLPNHLRSIIVLKSLFIPGWRRTSRVSSSGIKSYRFPLTCPITSMPIRSFSRKVAVLG